MEKEEKNIIGIVTAGALAFLASVEEEERQFLHGKACVPDLLSMSRGAIGLLAAADAFGALMAPTKDDFYKCADAMPLSGLSGAKAYALRIGYYERSAKLPPGLYLKHGDPAQLEKFSTSDAPSEEFMREFWAYFAKLFDLKAVEEAVRTGSRTLGNSMAS